MKLYTGIGDKGTTSILGATKVSKDDLRVQAYGSIDELNSNLGWLTTFSFMSGYVGQLRTIQNHLFNIGSELASTQQALPKLTIRRVNSQDIQDLEQWIDEQTEKLPELKSFVLPGNCPENAACHMARTVCRRAERAVVTQNSSISVDPAILIYLNRLSDYLFTLARTMTINSENEEIEWNS